MVLEFSRLEGYYVKGIIFGSIFGVIPYRSSFINGVSIQGCCIIAYAGLSGKPLTGFPGSGVSKLPYVKGLGMNKRIFSGGEWQRLWAAFDGANDGVRGC